MEQKGEKVNFSNSSLSKLDISKGENVTELDVSGNMLRELDLSDNLRLETLDCSGNPLRYIKSRVPSPAARARGLAAQAAQQSMRAAREAARAAERAALAAEQAALAARNAAYGTGKDAFGGAFGDAAGAAQEPLDAKEAEDSELDELPIEITATEEFIVLEAGKGGSVGLKYSPYGGQTYYAYPDEGYRFSGWFDVLGDRLSVKDEWNEGYGIKREMFALFTPL